MGRDSGRGKTGYDQIRDGTPGNAVKFYFTFREGNSTGSRRAATPSRFSGA